MWRYCCGVPLFVTVSLQTEDMRRRRRDGGGEVLARGRGVWRKRWSMWLRIMSKKLHKALSQITYQLCAWHYPWSISSVLDQVPHRSAVQVHVRPSAHTHTHIHSGPLAAKTRAIASLCLSLPPSLPVHLSLFQPGSAVASCKSKAKNKTCQVSELETPLVPAVGHSGKHSRRCPLSPDPVFGEASLSEQCGRIQCISIGKALIFICSAFVLSCCGAHKLTASAEIRLLVNINENVSAALERTHFFFAFVYQQ